MRLPEACITQDSTRITHFLHQAEQRSNHTPYELTLYGSAAVSLYLADEQQPLHQIRFTRDIDVNSSPGLHETTLNTYRPTDLEPPLHFQLRSVYSWLLHPDWEQDRVDFTPIIKLNHWKVFLLSPRDLILSKLIRYIKNDEDRDFDDCRRLTQRYLTSQDAFAAELEEALLYATTLSPWEQRRLRNVPEELFDPL